MKKSVMMKTLFTGLGLVALLSCEQKEDTTGGALEVTGVAILNSGEDGQTRAEGVLSGDTFNIEVSPLSDLTAAVLEITAPEGVTTTPANGATVDFEANGGEQALIANRGAEVKNYTIKVTKAELTDELMLSELTISGVAGASYTISQPDKTISISCSNLTGTVAQISGFVLNPSTATVKETVPAMITPEEGDPYMEVDLAADGDKYIVIANGSEEKRYDITATVSEAGFDPETAEIVFDQRLGSGLNPSLGTNNTRGSFFDGQYVFFASREGGNNIYYYDINDATNTIKSLNMGEGVVTTDSDWAVSDVRVAANGGIYVSSMAMTKDKKFNVYYWENVDATPVKMISYTVADPVNNATTVRIGDALTILGDPQTDGYIVTSNFASGNQNQAQFYMWQVTGGTVAAEPEIVDLIGQYEGASAADPAMGQYSRIAEIPDDPSHYIATGASCGLLILDSEFQVEFELKRDSPVQGRAQDPHFFEFNGVRYLTYTVNREWAANDAYLEVVALTEGDNYVDGLKGLADDAIDDVSVYRENITNNATAGAAWVSAANNVVVDGDNLYVFGYVCEYGAMVVKFTR